ncbi:glycoside hydrolase family 13 protein [Georgenia sunbinii]|uniref:glycoside hydrolase family 13 protein n=1 Tax=Georgenia sunbinii TaxID=3117728 RepID=UPI003D9C5869
MTAVTPNPSAETTASDRHDVVPRARFELHEAGSQTSWWRDAVIYQVYPRSFADSDGDGIGDLPGITARLPHLVELGVDAVWLSPFYRSPQKDAGYDVADYREVDPLFGVLEDADALIARAHELGLRVIVDLVPNHTSDQHAWFRLALDGGPGAAARARYIFREGNGEYGEEPPNNWQSVFGGPAWTRVRSRDDAGGRAWEHDGQWYLHLFDASQPDLNWNSRAVREEFRSVLRFWLDRGVDGFRVDVAHGLVKAAGLPDWSGQVRMVEGDSTVDDVPTDPTEPLPALDTDDPGDGRNPMFDQDGVHEIYREWRSVLEEYDGDRVLVAEAWVEPADRLARYVRPDEMHQAFNFEYLVTTWDAPALRAIIRRSFAANDAVHAPTTWVLSNHDVVRHASRLGLAATGKGPNGIGAEDPQPDAELGLRRARAATLLMLGLPGSAYLYQGEELGLPEHTTLDDSLRQDPAWWRTGHAEKGRDGCRVPLPWEAGKPALGFSPTGRTWLPQPASWASLAADVQRGQDDSTLELYREALRLRRELQLGHGGLALLPQLADSPHVIGLRNAAAPSSNGTARRPDVIVLANLGPEPVTVPVTRSQVLLTSVPVVLPRPGGSHLLLPPDTAVWARASH